MDTIIKRICDAALKFLRARAQRTPYFHLPGYMNRYWLVPYWRVVRRPVRAVDSLGAPYEGYLTDGTGPVSFRFRPVAAVLQRLGIAARLHCILRSDDGRDPHDHPWPYVTVILSGGYTEHRYDEHGSLLSSKWHGPGSVLFRRAADWHRLELLPGQLTWTLFITGAKQQGWGFLTAPGEKTPWHEYSNPSSRGTKGTGGGCLSKKRGSAAPLGSPDSSPDSSPAQPT